MEHIASVYNPYFIVYGNVYLEDGEYSKALGETLALFILKADIARKTIKRFLIAEASIPWRVYYGHLLYL